MIFPINKERLRQGCTQILCGLRNKKQVKRKTANNNIWVVYCAQKASLLLNNITLIKWKEPLTIL